MYRAGVALFAAVLAGCAATPSCNGIASADGSVCAVSRDPSIARADMRNLADQVAREKAALVAWLGNDAGPVTLIVQDRGNARHKPPATIFIPSRLIAKRYAITAHETTHVLTQGWASQVLKEGLAVYAQYRFGEQQGWPNYKRSVHAAAKHWRADHDAGVRTPDDAEAVLRDRPKGETDRLRAAYSVAGSWVQWLVEDKLDGDIGRFLNHLYRTGDYAGTFGTRYEALVGQWRAHLEKR